MSFWKRSMEYLGLGPDDAYDDYDDGPEPEPPGRQRQRDDHSRSSCEVVAGRARLGGRARRAGAAQLSVAGLRERPPRRTGQRR